MTKIVASKKHPELNIVSPIAKRPILNSRKGTNAAAAIYPRPNGNNPESIPPRENHA